MKIVELYLRVRQSVFVEGRSRRETARLFGIARKTVEAYLTRIYRKLGVRGRSELAAWAVREQQS